MTFTSRARHLRLRRTAACVLAITFTTLVGAQQQPTFRSSVEVTAIDVIVVDSSGRPITDLSADDFRVKVDGTERRVVTARWIPQTSPDRQAPIPAVIEGYSTNEGAIDGRLMLFAVDQPNLRFSAVAGVRPALDAFIDRLEPSDRLAAVAIGPGPSTPITTDRQLVKTALSRMTGEMESVQDMTTFNIALSEALEVTGGNGAMYDAVSIRECGDRKPPQVLPPGNCWERLLQDLIRISDYGSDSSTRTFAALRGLLDSLKKMSGPKTLVIVTEGFLLAQHGSEAVVELGEMAASAQTTIYILKIDDYTTDATVSQPSAALRDDRRIRRDAVELLAGVARGSVFDVLGSGDSALRQIEKEVAGYYLIGVESLPTDRDGKWHKNDVKVRRPRAIVRARTGLANTAAATRTPADDIVNALSSPFSNPGLPLRVTTSPFREGDGPNIQLLMHVEAGGGYSSNTKVSLGYVISDMRGNIVSKSAGTATLPPATPGSPSPLFYTNGVTLPPGEYALKFAMTEGDRVGSVDHLIHAVLPEAGSGRVSDLVVGGPVDDNEPPRPAIGYDVSFGRVQGYIEAYGRDVHDWMTTYEVSTNADGPPILSVGVPGRVSGDGRMIFSKTLPVSDLAPGKYYFRAALASNDHPLKTVSRQFRISPLAPSMTATSAAVFALAPRGVRLPVSSTLFALAFVREQALGDTLDRFRRTVATAARPAFDAGSAAFVRGDYTEAQRRFRAAVQPAFAGANNMAPLAYLAAVTAASGNDQEAVSIWQTALTVGSAVPEVYEWYGQALMRLGRVPQASIAFAEGAAKWPADPRFNRSLAFVYARLGQSREALQALAAYVSQRPTDLEMLRIGVEWVYRAHATGSVVPEPEKAAARRWVEAYERGNGPNPADLRDWLQRLETDGTPEAAPPGPI